VEAVELKSYLIQKFLEWFDGQRKLYLPKARFFSKEEKSLLEKYFEKRIIDSVGVAMVEHISNPEFYGELTEQGLPIPLDFSEAAALTLIDCILLRKIPWHSFSSQVSIIFHEMVHVVQIDILGLEKMAELYLSSLFRNGYSNVPFEKQADILTSRFTKGESFLVEEVVKQELKQIGSF